MVQDFVGALVAGEFAAVIGAAGADDMNAVKLAPLDGGGADAAARPVDENGFAGLGFGFLEEGAVGGGVRNVEAGGFFKADVVGKFVDVIGFADRKSVV